MASQREDDGGGLSHMANLIKAILWPAIVGVCLYYWIRPVTTIVQTLPDLISHASTISLGGVELKINPSVLPKPSDEVAGVLNRLSNDQLADLMAFNPGTHYCINSSYKDLKKASLADLKLLDQQDNGTGDNCKNYYQLAELGSRTRDYLLSLISAQIKK